MGETGLKLALEKWYLKYHTDYLSLDPLHLVRAYKEPRDQEVVGFIAAAFSIGRADLFQKAIVSLLRRMGASPFLFLLHFHPRRDLNQFSGFIYRFYSTKDVGLLLWWLHQILEEYGSLQSLFLKGYQSEEKNVGSALSRFVQTLLGLHTYPICHNLPPKGSGVRHYIADPSDGSGCKRLNLFLRWMVRRDDLDLGLWSDVLPSKLIIPLDTHIARLSWRIGLTHRTTPGWKMAVEITEELRKFDFQDPVKYDFALCTIGKLFPCPNRPHFSYCFSCPLFRFCQFRKEGTMF